MGEVSVLGRPVMTAREAARQLRIPSSTLTYWLEGGTRKGKSYQPVLREQATGSADVTWGEVVEARYLRAYRQRHDISMQRLRPFISELRDVLGVPYPLAHAKPYVGPGQRLLLEVQERTHLPEELRAVYEVTTGQLILAHPASDFFQRVDFSEGENGEAVQMFPAGRRSPVVMRPTISSAAATVRGIRTEVIAELADARVPVEDIAQDFGISVDYVKAALSYEWSEAA
ncbi:MAG: DUF433 domain-containing protein [Actinomycetota bacterium]|nr:DUF433 domain-containing protein [Actinomycetota bacterium]